MDGTGRSFPEDLLGTALPSGFEGTVQRRWVRYVEGSADEVRTDAYDDAVAVHEGETATPGIAAGGHADEIGPMVRDVTDGGTLALSRVGGSDRTVMRGRYVTVHADDPVHGVIGRTAIHLREDDDEPDGISALAVDVGADGGRPPANWPTSGIRSRSPRASRGRPAVGARVAGRATGWGSGRSPRRSAGRSSATPPVSVELSPSRLPMAPCRIRADRWTCSRTPSARPSPST